MKRIIRTALVIVGVILILLLTVPLLVPVSPLPGLVPPEQVADPDSEFIEVNGLRVHVKRSGQGEPVMILLHGFGSHTESWRSVRPTLATAGTVIAFDRPAFGLTERPSAWSGPNPYGPDAQVALVIGLLDKLGIQRAILVGNSAGGTISAQVALRQPTRVSALVLVDPAIYVSGGTPSWLRPVLNSPQMRHLGPLLARSQASNMANLLLSAYHDPTKVTAEMLALYQRPLKVENWDRAFYEFLAAGQASGSLPDDVKRLALPVLVVTGEFDTWVPTAQSIRLSQEIPGAQLAVIATCGHVPQEECPQDFLRAVLPFVQAVGR
jgi:pimeloyl-ACP methyl ester carboxylesterase